MLDYLLYSLITVSLSGIGYCILALRTVSEGNEALVERFGKFNRKLAPGMHLVTPFIDTIVVEDTNREKVLDIKPQNTITKDNVMLEVDAVIYWKIIDLQQTFYEVEEIDRALQNLVVTTLRSEIGGLDLEETYSARDNLNKKLLRELDEATSNWGVKITRVEVQELQPTQTVVEALEKERAAKSLKRAEVTEAEGLVQSIEMISGALDRTGSRQKAMQFLIAQRYLDANEKIGTSNNSKILFMNPGELNEALSDLMTGEGDSEPPRDSL